MALQRRGDDCYLRLVQIRCNLDKNRHPPSLCATLAIGAGVLAGQHLSPLGNGAQQGIQRCITLQSTQILRVGRADIHRDVVGVRVHAIQTGQVVCCRIFDGGGSVFADVQAQQHRVAALLRAELGLLHVAHKSFQPVVVEAQPVDQCLGLGQAEHAGFGVARLWFGRHGADFDKAKTHGTQGINAAGIFVQTCGHAHPVRKSQACQLDGVVHGVVAPGPLQGRALATREHVHGEIMGGFGVHAKQKGAGEGVGNQ